MKRIIFPIAILALVVGTALLFGTRSTAQTEISFSISPDSMRQIQALIHEKESRTPAQQKIDSQLLVASKMRRGLPIAEGVKELQVNVGADDNGMVDVVISGIIDEKLLNDLSKIGVAVKDSLPAYRSLSAHVPLNQLETIATLEQVRFIQPKQEYRLAQQKFSLFRPDRSAFPSGDRSDHIPGRGPQIKDAIAEIAGRPETPIQIGSASTEGDMAHRALSARGTFNVDGTGVKIGVLSDGINSLTAAQASGDLGPVTVLPGQAGDGDEGTAMLEIIHDIAPGAQLFFATGTSGIGSFAQNIRGLRAVGCDIIVDDIGYYVESPFQDGQNPNILSTRNGGIVTQAVNDVVGSGALFFSAAGNSGNRNDDTSSVWEGDFVNGGPLFPAPDGFPGGNVHDFDSTEQVAQFNTIRLGAGTPITLHWSDPIGASDNDYDIYVLNRFGGLVTASNNVQTGTQDPYEQIGSMGNSVNFRIVIVQKTGAAPRFLHLGNFDGQLTHNTGGEIHGHASASGSLGVAASPAVPTFPGSFSPSNEVEIFSSDGFRRIFFNPDGSSITPGNVSATGGILLQQPVFTAADGVSISGAGGFSNPFFGTSAAAPHAAAIAALISSGNPTLSPAQITNAMTSTAIDIEGPGVDPDSGHGIVMPYAALQSLGGPVNGKAFLEIVTVSQTETCCNGDGFILPGESGTLNIILRNTGLVNASGISASLTTSTPGVIIQNASSVYPDAQSQQGATTNVTPFSISLVSTLPQDPRGRFTLTIHYIGGHSPSQVWDFDVQFGFQPLAFNPGANSTVYALAVQPDGKVIVGGKFAGLAGLGGQVRNGIGRLNADGTLDPTFDPGTFDNTFVTLPDIGRVYTIAIQANGKIIVGGQFTHLGGRGTIPRSRIGRLNSDGTIDTSFNPGALAAYPAVVYALMIQPDGKILVGGEFTTLGGQSRSCI